MDKSISASLSSAFICVHLYPSVANSVFCFIGVHRCPSVAKNLRKKTGGSIKHRIRPSSIQTRARGSLRGDSRLGFGLRVVAVGRGLLNRLLVIRAIAAVVWIDLGGRFASD